MTDPRELAKRVRHVAPMQVYLTGTESEAIATALERLAEVERELNEVRGAMYRDAERRHGDMVILDAMRAHVSGLQAKLEDAARESGALREGNETKATLLEAGAAMHARDTARIEKLEAALRRWPCDGYLHSTEEEPESTCNKCHGKGLHPIAAEALGMMKETKMANSDRWGVWITSQPGCEPRAECWLGNPTPLCLSEDMARAIAGACNAHNGVIWRYEARELPA